MARSPLVRSIVLAALVACGTSNSPSPSPSPTSGSSAPAASAGSSAPASRPPPPVATSAAIATATAIASADAGSAGIAIHGSASGRIESSGQTGTWVLEHGPCYSGDLDGYFGAQAESEASDGIGIRFLKDPLKGWAMKVNVADTCKLGGTCQAVLFLPEQCKTFDVQIALDTKHGRRVKWFDGAATVDCRIGATRVAGTLTLHACRN